MRKRMFIPRKSIKKYDVFMLMDPIKAKLIDDRCYIITEIDSVNVTLSSAFVTGMIVDLCDYQDLNMINIRDIKAGKVGSNPMYRTIWLSDIVIVARLMASNEFDIYHNTKDNPVTVRGIELDFGEYDVAKEEQEMTDIMVENIVNYPSMAKEFIDVYRDSKDINEVMDLYDLSKKQVERTVNGIIAKYAIHSPADINN